MDPSPETIELHATENAEKDFTGSKEPYTTQASDRFSVYSVDLKSVGRCWTAMTMTIIIILY